MARNISGVIGPQTQVSYDPGLTYGVTNFAFPSTPGVNAAIGTTAGLLNLVAMLSGSAAASPASIDLTATTDPYGVAVNFAKINSALFLNWSTTDANILLLDGTVSNAWKALFNAITTAKLVIPPGCTSNGTICPGFVHVGGFNTTGLAVSGTSKVISLDPGANTISYSVMLFGR